jgi:uncharacterized membrane protein YkoI
MKRKLIPVAVATLCALTIAGTYAAKSSSENDALAVTSAKIDLSQAVSAAEQHVGGKASKAEVERSKGQWVFDVEVVNQQKKVFDVKVDPASGKVISATEDKLDQDDNEDEND